MSSSAPKVAKKVGMRRMIVYIEDHVGDLSIEERHDVYQMLINSGISDSRIHTKGNGLQINFRDMPDSTIHMIYNFINTKVSSKMEELQYFPDGEEEEEPSE